jgi:hypothetical protein
MEGGEGGVVTRKGKSTSLPGEPDRDKVSLAFCPLCPVSYSPSKKAADTIHHPLWDLPSHLWFALP